MGVQKQRIDVLPLELFQPSDPDQLDALSMLLADSHQTRQYYIENFIFATTTYITGGGADVKSIPGTRAKMTRLSSSSMDLGGEMLFRVRIGFTGTPSEVLPKAFEDEKGQRCVYEPGDDAQIISTLTSPKHMSVETVDGSHPAS